MFLILLFIFSSASNEPVVTTHLSIAPGALDYSKSEFVPLTSSTQVKWRTRYWIRAEIMASAPGRYAIQAGNRYMQLASFYDERGNLLGSGNYVITDLGRDQSTFYIYYPFADEKDLHLFSINVTPEDSFLKAISRENLVQASFTSFLLFLVVMSLIFALLVSDRLYWYYCFYIATFIIYFSYQYGTLSLLFPVVKHFPPTWIYIFGNAITLAYILFMQSFLSLKKTDPLVYKVLSYGIGFVIFLIVLETMMFLIQVDLQHSPVYKGALILVESVSMSFVLYRIYIQKNVLSFIFIIGAAVISLTSLFGQVVSTLHLATDNNYIIQAGMALEIFIFTVGIGVRVNVINNERHAAQVKLIEQLQLNEAMQQQYTSELEMKVMERTSALDKRNKENETLLKEIHHRVKNNLQTISSLLSLQSRQLTDEHAIKAVREGNNRVHSMGLIHEKLYRQGIYSTVDMKDYTRSLSESLARSYGFDPSVIKLESMDVSLDLDKIVPLGLILNEVISNSMKHAFNAISNPMIRIGFLENKGNVKLYIHDNGNGMPEKNKSDSFGIKLVHILSKELDGNAVFQKDGGTLFTLEFDNRP